jgi:hypothetical protein
MLAQQIGRLKDHVKVIVCDGLEGTLAMPIP